MDGHLPQTYAAFHTRQHGIPYAMRPYGSLDLSLYQRNDKKHLLKRLWAKLFDLPNKKIILMHKLFLKISD